jgi:MYXO-CTERM domain-containing protein
MLGAMWHRVTLLALGVLASISSGCGDATGSGSVAGSSAARAAAAPSSTERQPSDALYRFESRSGLRGEPAFIAEHPLMGLRSEFGRGQVLLYPPGAHAAPGLSLHAAAWGCPDALEDVPAREPSKSSESDEIKFGDASAPLVEWYRHRESGLEQGFTVSTLPACAEASGSLLIVLERSAGWSSSVADDHSQATFSGVSGGKIRYSEAYARGALGGVHAVQIVSFEDRVALEIDVQGVELPLEIDPLAWTEQQKVTASNGQDSDFFGSSVALNGNLLASGAPGNDDKAAGAGAVYAYTRTGSTWSNEQKILASDGAASDSFGRSVAISSTYLAAGANLDDDAGANSGAVYVYTRSGSTWSGEKKVVAPDAQAGDQFGSVVALDGTTLVVGAPFDDDLGANAGAAYVFTFTGTSWAFQQKLTATDAGADASDNFGASVAISGNTVIVGAPFDSDVQSLAGAAYVFLRTGNTWAQQQKLVDDAKADDYAGEAVAIDGDSAVVGAYDNGDKAAQAGTAWVWTRSGTVWSRQQKLFPKVPVTLDQFGYSVTIRGDVAVVGATGDPSSKGSAYVFTRAGTVWTETTKLQAADGVANDTFGISVSLDGTTLATGAIGAGTTGAVYLATLTDGSACAVDIDCKSGHCVEGVCCNTACANTCQSCLASRKASGADGVCGNIKTNTDPRNGCATQTASTCGTTGVCNGSGACTQFANGTECVAAACPTTTSENPADSCNGSGSCVSTPAAACKRGYLCKAGACLATCSTAADCDASEGFVCSGGKCLVPQGQGCSVNADCALAHCVDGVCCDTACNQKCNSCLASEKLTGADGVCGAIKVDTDPADECAAAADACGADGQCDGQGACRSFAKPQTLCLDSKCVDEKHEDPARACNGSGKCVDAADVACERGYLCKAGACLTTCTTTADCDATAGFECTGGLCQVPQAGACQVDLDCATGHCSDHVCCDTACGQKCNSCLKEETGVDTGTCAPIPADQDPANECPDNPNTSGDPACGPDGSCDGVGNCRSFAKPSTACGETSCVDDVITGKLCNGEGICADDSITCAPYLCGDTAACSSDCQKDQDCHLPDQDGYVGAFCNIVNNIGTCTDKLTDGSPCERKEACQSGFCTDGLCCNKGCDGQCEACGEKGAEGKCVPVLGDPRGERAVCPEAPADEPCQAASCNGKVGDHCAGFATSKVKCQDPRCEDGQATGQGLCDGDGNCGVAAPVECGAYVCGPSQCLTNCDADKDCVAGNSCVDHECLSGAKCSDDGLSVVEVNSTSTSCGAFTCQAGACLKNCSSTDDCAPAYVCDVDSKQCIQPLAPPADDSGCGCRAVGGTSPDRSWLAVVLSLTLLGARRRRRAS